MLEKGFTVPALSQPALPASPSWFPLPPGWLVLGALLLATVAVILFFRYARWRRNRWRREALALLPASHSVDDWLNLIKQVLLVHQPRATVSQSLTAQSLLQPIPLDNDLHQQMCAKYCQRDNQLAEADESRLRRQLATWLKELPDV
ncbi:DUF4381 family protein [Scandinavium sp. V105_16]|uniref:DUF4381 family protein n=1 Tax=Scandinavium lactucae TaxID=3095028 RepID=A0AAJ2S597_9ENTR|nr:MULTISPECIES: DUF4381 family protein [unclassified Scandinavium]MDX6018808.1 DUF4381 family protein [Scandinavium sp. V105_16]MDX6030231.1 DUF4381 family protein [Scandinavium sp. V105_12]MDX6039103.1 DUF4381 family protein [Scandinavium sp. V105_6]MDX6050174.1 DUF4381 family protein [Scandinavium sp. V105_1]